MPIDRILSSPGAASAYLRRFDAQYFDFGTAQAFTAGSPVTPTMAGVQGTINTTSYRFFLPTTSVAVFPDGFYTLELAGGGGNDTFFMVNGSDRVPPIALPWGTFVSATATTLVIAGGTLINTSGIYGPSGGSASILGPRLRVTSAALTTTPFGYTSPANTGHTTLTVGPNINHTFTFSANTPILAAVLAGLATGDIVTVLT